MEQKDFATSKIFWIKFGWGMLNGGFSRGSELPTGMLAGGLLTWISDKRKLSQEIRRSNMVSSITATFGGLMTAPLSAFLIPLEMPHIQTIESYGSLIIAAVTAVLGFSVFFISGINHFDGLLRLLDLPQYTFLHWHLVVTLRIGFLGTAVAWILRLSIGILKILLMPLKRGPILRSTQAGVILGLLGMALHLTLFVASEGLVFVIENAVQIGAALLVVSIIAMILVTAGALSTGFIGGTIFPMSFCRWYAGKSCDIALPKYPPRTVSRVWNGSSDHWDPAYPDLVWNLEHADCGAAQSGFGLYPKRLPHENNAEI